MCLLKPVPPAISTVLLLWRLTLSPANNRHFQFTFAGRLGQTIALVASWWVMGQAHFRPTVSMSILIFRVPGRLVRQRHKAPARRSVRLALALLLLVRMRRPTAIGSSLPYAVSW